MVRKQRNKTRNQNSQKSSKNNMNSQNSIPESEGRGWAGVLGLCSVVISVGLLVYGVILIISWNGTANTSAGKALLVAILGLLLIPVAAYIVGGIITVATSSAISLGITLGKQQENIEIEKVAQELVAEKSNENSSRQDNQGAAVSGDLLTSVAVETHTPHITQRVTPFGARLKGNIDDFSIGWFMSHFMILRIALEAF